MAGLLLFLALVPAASSAPKSLPRNPVRYEVLDAENFVIRSTDPMSAVTIDGLYENTDFVVDWMPRRKEAYVRLLSNRASLRVRVESLLPSGLVSRHAWNLPAPTNARRPAHGP
jgi:hypothetical protein